MIGDTEALEERLSRPTDALVRSLAGVEGDLLILGVGGKMGPTFARMAVRASRQAGCHRRVVGVSRFSDQTLPPRLHAYGVETIAADLLDAGAVAALPDMPNVISMVGRKFGTAGAAPLTWATNTYLPALVCRRFPDARILAFSTGNVYRPMPVNSDRMSLETDRLEPVGEYGMSSLGRERTFEYFSRKFNTPVTLIRLNYATELRYGVLVDLAQKVYRGEPIALAVGYANVIWQGDASAMALAALAHADTPPWIVNVTGPERISVRAVSEQFGRLFDRPVRFLGSEGPTALLSDARRALARYGPPQVTLDEMIHWIADWLDRGGVTLNKPTHFEVADGKF